MTIFSIVLLGLIFVFFFKKSKGTMTDIFINLTALAIALELMISIGSFISIGGLSIGYSEFLIVIDVVIAIILLRRVGLGKRTVLLGGVFILSCLVSLILAIAFPYEGVVVPEDYVKNINQVVSNRIRLSKLIIEKDYYRKVLGE